MERHAGNDCLQLNCICVQLPVRISFKNHLDLYYLWIHFNLQIVVGYFIGPFLCCPIIRCLRHHNVNSKSRVNKKPCVCTCCSVKGGQTIVFADIAKITSDPHTMFVESFNDIFEIIKIFHKNYWSNLLFTIY